LWDSRHLLKNLSVTIWFFPLDFWWNLYIKLQLSFSNWSWACLQFLVLHMINFVNSWCLLMGTKFDLGLTLQPGMNQTQHFLQLVQLVYRFVQRTSNSTLLKSVVLLQLEASSQFFSIPNSVFSGWYCSRAKIFHSSHIWIHFESTKFW